MRLSTEGRNLGPNSQRSPAHLIVRDFGFSGQGQRLPLRRPDDASLTVLPGLRMGVGFATVRASGVMPFKAVSGVPGDWESVEPDGVGGGCQSGSNSHEERCAVATGLAHESEPSADGQKDSENPDRRRG